MGRLTKTVCDRCGREMDYGIGWTSRLKNAVRKGKSIKIRKLYCGNPDGYSYSDRDYELCCECTKELEKFLKKKAGGVDDFR